MSNYSRNQDRRNFMRNTAHEVASRAIVKPVKTAKADAEKVVRIAFAQIAVKTERPQLRGSFTVPKWAKREK